MPNDCGELVEGAERPESGYLAEELWIAVEPEVRVAVVKREGRDLVRLDGTRPGDGGEVLTTDGDVGDVDDRAGGHAQQRRVGSH